MCYGRHIATNISPPLTQAMVCSSPGYLSSYLWFYSIDSRFGLIHRPPMRKPYVDMIGMVYVLQPHFWVWRVGGPYAMGTVEVPQGGAQRVGPFFGRHIAIQPVLHTILKRHPCTIFVFVILLIFVTCLFVDAIRTATFGYAAVPIGFLFGKLRLMF